MDELTTVVEIPETISPSTRNALIVVGVVTATALTVVGIKKFRAWKQEKDLEETATSAEPTTAHTK